MSNLPYHAVKYLEAGYHLLALSGKRPNPRYHGKRDDEEVGWSWEKSIHGAPETEEEVKAVYEVFEHPSTTGIALLIPKDVLVADLDTDAAFDLFATLWDGRKARTASTPNGVHVWFEAPGADKSIWLGGRVLLFKGFGGYVAAPPSRHFNAAGEEDGVYTWASEGPLGIMSDAMARQVRAANALETGEVFKRETAIEPELHFTSADGVLTAWASYNIDGLLSAVRDAREGNRNNMLAWAALTAAEEGVPLEVGMPALTEAARAAGLTGRETRITIRAAYSRRSRG